MCKNNDWDLRSDNDVTIYPKSLSEVMSEENCRDKFIEEVKKIVCTGDRYGAPEDSFDLISKLWSVYLGKEISSVDVCMLMSLLKIVRVKNNPSHTDSLIDLAGYSCCAYEKQETK